MPIVKPTNIDESSHICFVIFILCNKLKEMKKNVIVYEKVGKLSFPRQKRVSMNTLIKCTVSW